MKPQLLSHTGVPTQVFTAELMSAKLSSKSIKGI
jgi:hypothetical protein